MSLQQLRGTALQDQQQQHTLISHFQVRTGAPSRRPLTDKGVCYSAIANGLRHADKVVCNQHRIKLQAFGSVDGAY